MFIYEFFVCFICCIFIFRFLFRCNIETELLNKSDWLFECYDCIMSVETNKYNLSEISYVKVQNIYWHKHVMPLANVFNATKNNFDSILS